MLPALYMKHLLAPVLSICLAATAFAQTPQLAPLPVNGFVTLEQIVSDFRTAPDAAIQKYGGNRITVFGRVGKLEQPGDGNNILSVYLQVFNDPTPDVKCIFAQDAFRQNAQIQISADGSQASEIMMNQENMPARTVEVATVDGRIGVKGSFDNFAAGDIILKDCRKVSKEEIEKLSAGQ